MEEVVRRDVDGAHDPLAALAEVEDVDARGRLLEVAEVEPPPRQGVRQDRAVDAAVEDGECRVPVVGGDDRVDGGEDAIEELADRLAA